MNDATAVEFSVLSQNAARELAPDQAGNLNAIAGMAAGVTAVPGGISVGGLGSAQNGTTLNGLAFAGADIPPDAYTRVRITSSSCNPSLGWFSGARMQVELPSGALFTSRNLHYTLDTPAAQLHDPVSAKLGQRYSNFNGSVSGMGQLVDDK